jgi:hypothetical protein
VNPFRVTPRLTPRGRLLLAPAEDASTGVMERICRPKTGLFPAPAEIEFSCSCPGWATRCKHVAAVLCGIGARLDERPELLFALRRVDEKALIAGAGRGLPLSRTGPAAEKRGRRPGLRCGSGRPA